MNNDKGVRGQSAKKLEIDEFVHWDGPEPPIERPLTWSERVRVAVDESVGAEDIAKAQSPSTKMLLALQRTGKHIYQGTVPAAVKARRRARGKRARHARRAAR